MIPVYFVTYSTNFDIQDLIMFLIGASYTIAVTIWLPQDSFTPFVSSILSQWV